MKIEDIRKEVFAQKPHFAALVTQWGEKTVLEYYQQDFQNLLTPSVDVQNAVHNQTKLILGEAVAKKASAAVAQKKWVNTADHHGLLSHPYFYTAALARSSHSVQSDSQTTVTLPFGGVSLSNDSFPRGFSFHDMHNNDVRVFFKSLEKRRLPVYSLEPVTKDELLVTRDKSRSVAVSKQAHEKLELLFSNFLTENQVWDQSTYSAQLTAMNSVLWKTLFGTSRGDFVYLEIDSVVNELLLKKHVCSKTEVHELLFNSQWRDAFVELFSGITGSHTENSGTHLFWYIDHNLETRRSLRIKGETLTTTEQDISISLSPEAIATGLENRTLMPSTALLLIVLQGSEKLACGGGPSQLSYLTNIINTWSELLARFDVHTTVPTTAIWCGDNTLFQVTETKSNTSNLATLIDILLYEKNPNQSVETALETTSIAKTVDAMIPVLYGIYAKQKLQERFQYSIPKIYIS